MSRYFDVETEQEILFDPAKVYMGTLAASSCGIIYRYAEKYHVDEQDIEDTLIIPRYDQLSVREKNLIPTRVYRRLLRAMGWSLANKASKELLM